MSGAKRSFAIAKPGSKSETQFGLGGMRRLRRAIEDNLSNRPGRRLAHLVGRIVPSIDAPEPQLRWAWRSLQIGSLTVAVSPLIGAIAIFGSIILTYKHCWPRMRRDRLLWAWAALAVWLVIVTVAAIDRGNALLGLANLLPFFLALGSFRHLIQTPAQVLRLFWLLLCGSLPVTVLGLGQMWAGWHGPVTAVIFDWALAAGGSPIGRLSSVFSYANVTAHYLTLIWSIGLGLVVATWFAGRSPGGSPGDSSGRSLAESGGRSAGQPAEPAIDQHQHRHDRRIMETTMAIAAGLTGLVGVALFLTQSRNAWGLAAIDTVIWATASGGWWLLAGAAAVAATVLGAAFGPAGLAGWLRTIVPRTIWARLNDDLFPDRPPATLRSSQWAFAWDHANQRPLTGWGLNSFSDLYQAATNTWLGHPHNIWLMLAMETGWPATITLTGLVGWTVARAAIGLVQRLQRPGFDARLGLDPAAANSAEISHQVVWAGAIGLVGFLNATAFHGFDVTLFDLRTNVIDWLVLGSLAGLARSGWLRPIARP